MTKEEYPYLYETHLHTCSGSACARNSGAEMARACKEAGYTGMIVTDHNWYGNTAVDRSLPWQEWVERFCIGYEEAKAWGDANDFQVFFGYEAGYRGTEFLIYGVDKEWMIKHPQIREASVEEQYLLIREAGGAVVQAHPYREEPYIPKVRLFPEWVDAIEGINATHSNPRSRAHNVKEWDDKAIALARRCGKPITAGSDLHGIDVLGGGMALKRKLRSIEDFCEMLHSDEDYLLTNGAEWFDRNGTRL